MNESEIVKNVTASFFIDNNKIVHIILHNVTIDKDDEADALLIIKKLSVEKKVSKLIDARLFYSVFSTDAKKYWLQSSVYKDSPAIAFLVRSNITMYFANFYLKIFPQKTKTRYFTNHSKGYEWLIKR